MCVHTGHTVLQRVKKASNNPEKHEKMHAKIISKTQKTKHQGLGTQTIITDIELPTFYFIKIKLSPLISKAILRLILQRIFMLKFFCICEVVYSLPPKSGDLATMRDIIFKVKKSKLNCTGNLRRTNDDRWTTKVLYWIPRKQKRPKGDHSVVRQMELSNLQEQNGEEPQKTGQAVNIQIGFPRS